MNLIKKYLREIGIFGIFGLLITATTYIVNLNRDIEDLKKGQVSKEEIRQILKEELQLQFIKKQLLNQ